MSAPAEKKPNEARPGLAEVPVIPPTERQGQASRAHALELRRKRGRRLAKRVGLFVLLPTLLATAYYGALASDQFESFSLFTVQSSEMSPALMDGLLPALAGGGQSRDALAVRDYILSRDMLGRLDKEHGFIAHYKDARRDWFARLRHDASFEESYLYFGRKVFADFDQTSGAVTIQVRAFDAKTASTYAQSILAYSEEMVNKLSQRERRDRISFAEAEVKKAEGRLVVARKAIVSLQQKHEDFNPLQTATATLSLRTELEGELAKARAELLQLKSFMKDDAPQVLVAKEKVKSISAQVSGESRRLVDPKKPGGLNASFADFEGAMVEKEFAQKAYESAMATLEVARAEADRQHRYVAVIAAPSVPDESTYPLRIRSTAAAFVLSFLLWGVGTMIAAAVKEHARL